LLLASGGALVQDATGLYVGANSVTNAMLVNSTVPVDVDGAGTTTMTLGTTFNYFGTANRITTSATSNTVTFDIAATYVGQSSITTLGTVTTGTWNATTIAANHGGTGYSSYAVGDLLYANSTSTLAQLAVGTTDQVLVSDGTNPTWGQVSLTAGVTGVLPSANGGTGVNNSFNITLGGAINTAGAFSTAGANALTLTTTAATNVTLPTSGTLLTTADTSNYVASFSAGSTGFTPNSATTGAVTLAGTLNVAHGGTGATSLTAHGVVIGNSTSAVNVTSAGATGTVLKGQGASADPIFAAVDLTTDVGSSILPSANGGTGVDNSTGAVGTVLAATSTGNFTAKQMQYWATGSFTAATPATITHNLGQQHVLVQVYDTTGTPSQIIPDSIVLTSTSALTVTLNQSLASALVVVVGLAGASNGTF
jgi:hypothetical protein